MDNVSERLEQLEGFRARILGGVIISVRINTRTGTTAMRTIHIEKDLKIRLPGQTDEYCAGMEVGVLAAMLSTGRTEAAIHLGSDNLEIGKSLARKMGYHLASSDSNADGSVTAVFRNRRERPVLKLVASN